MLNQEMMDRTFENPPATIAADVNTSIILKNGGCDNDNIDERDINSQLTKDDNASQSPVMLTQPILSDGDDESDQDSKHNKDKKQSVDSSTISENLKTVQYKGQPVWELNIKNISLIKRMDDMKYLWDPISKIIQQQNSDIDENEINELNKNIKTEFSCDENNDYWLSKDFIKPFLIKYSIEKLIDPLFKFEPNDVNENNTNKKRLNNEVHVYESPTKKSKLNLERELDIQFFDHDLISGNSNAPFTLKPLTEDNLINENSKVIISSLFLPYQKEITLDEILKNQETFLSTDSKPKDGDNQINETTTGIIDKDQINIDVSIGDHGQNALHLAATLGKISLVKELIGQGANRFRGDDDGQTALIRAVHVTNCFELSCFDKLLDLLYPSITLLDNRGRTILHHISLTCGLKGRYDSSKYYLETLLEWVVKKGAKLPNNSLLKLSNFINEVVNKSDKFGNTCLNYATLAGNKYIVSQLLDIGADPYKANKIGVTPGDYGIDVNSSIVNSTTIENNDGAGKAVFNDNIGNNNADHNKNSNQNHNNNNKSPNNEISTSELANNQENITLKTNNTSNNNNSNSNESKNNSNSKISSSVKQNSDEFKESSSLNSLKILDSIQLYISNLGNEFKEEINQKSQQIDKLNPILKEKTLKLSQKRKQYDELQQMVQNISKMTNKIDNLTKAINEEEVKFEQEVKTLSIKIDDDENSLGNFDADQPFTITNLYEDVELIVENLLNEKLKKLKDEKHNANDDSNDDDDIDIDNNDISNFNIIEALNSIDPSDILPYYQNKLTNEKVELLKQEIQPSVVLDARIRAYEKNNQILMDRMNKKKNCNKELESQFKRIIGLCIGTDTENIDDKLLSSLLMSVENDPDPEIGQIKKVLKIVGDLDADDDEAKN